MVRISRSLSPALCVVFATTLLAGPSDAGADRRYSWPLSPRPQVVTPYSAPELRWQPGHRGVDLDAPPGSPVLAAGRGTVAFAGTVAGKPVVSIRHPDGLLTTYEPVEASVSKGRAVARGEVIGTLAVGHPGCPTSACLHWGARRGAGRAAAYVNPLSLMGAVRVRLKPVGVGGE